MSDYVPSNSAKAALSVARTSAQEETLRIAPLLLPMNQEERIVFFSKRLQVWLGHMRAAIGHEASRAIVDVLKEWADGGGSNE